MTREVEMVFKVNYDKSYRRPWFLAKIDENDHDDNWFYAHLIRKCVYPNREDGE